ncbi:glycosyltransferase family 4 protein [Alistipes communis]|uniref:glycosyltransferase family 4 protein n=1 Tax=Alistipes communis TaxID=2585118 RepID=UPI0003724508|nr:glycosyltransferase family 4 protein [Alistipes communis]
MRIAFIGGRDVHTLGGIENYMFNLATELAKAGYEPIVYCESDRDEVEQINGFQVIHQRSVGGRFLCKILLGYRATVRSLWGPYRADIFHYNAWPPSLASWLPRLFGRPALLQGHGLEWKRTKYTPRQQRIMRFMEFLTAKMNNHLIMVSEEQTDYFRLHYRKRCTTIPTATHLHDKPVRSDILDRFGLEAEGYFLFLGRLVPDKNPDCLIRAFLRSGITDKKLVVAGSNDAMPAYVDSLHVLAQEDDRIRFTGAVYGADKEKLIEACFAFCIPSTIEGLAITLLEAMSYGKACIASDIPANKEALGQSGIWCRYEDADGLAEQLVYAHEHPSELARQGRINRQRIRDHFTWEAVTAQYIDYLQQICEHERS